MINRIAEQYGDPVYPFASPAFSSQGRPDAWKKNTCELLKALINQRLFLFADLQIAFDFSNVLLYTILHP